MNERPTLGTTIRRLLGSYPFLLGLALVFGLAATLESWLPVLLLVAVVFGIVSVYRPTVPLLAAFFGILMDAQGMTATRIMGIPLTLSKVGVLLAIGAYFVHAVVTRKPLITPTPLTAGFAAILTTMVMSLITAILPSWGYTDTVGVIMLVVMVHLIYQAIPASDLPWVLRIMAAMAIGVYLWTLFTQRKQGFFVTLDHAWQQRTSGAYGDPNAWSTALLVVSPMLIGALANDKHWLAKPLLLGMVITFPACIFQSMSRAGLLSFMVISPGLVYILRRHRSLLIAGAVALVLAAPMFINIEAMLLRYQTLVDPTLEADLGHGSLSERKHLLEAGIKIFLENPVLGVGVGLFRLHASYVSAGQVWKIAHNSYVNVAAEQGVPGLLSHLYLGYQLYQSAWNAANRSRGDYALGLGQGFLLSVLAFSAMAFTLNLITFAAAYFMLGLGLLVARNAGAEVAFDRSQPAPLRAAPTALLETK